VNRHLQKRKRSSSTPEPVIRSRSSSIDIDMTSMAVPATTDPTATKVAHVKKKKIVVWEDHAEDHGDQSKEREPQYRTRTIRNTALQDVTLRPLGMAANPAK
jgi:hypothetical protein